MADIFGRSRVVSYASQFGGESEPSLRSTETRRGRSVSFRILGANAIPLHGETRTNASSIVVLVEMAGMGREDPTTRLLMMGDGEATVEERLIRDHASSIRLCTLLHIGHHGAQIAGTPPFRRLVDPRVAQVSADQSWGHPYETTIHGFTGDPTLRVNEARPLDPTHSMVLGRGGRGNQFHYQEETTAAILPSVGQQYEDTSNSARAEQARRAGATPMVAVGQRWTVTFTEDGALRMRSTLPGQSHDIHYL